VVDAADASGGGATPAALRARAEALADRLGLPLASRRDRGRYALHLTVTPARLELRVAGTGGPGVDADLAGGRGVWADLAKLDTASPAGRSLKQPIFKAIGLRSWAGPRPSVLDATAGLGEDAWLLASAGCAVRAVERHPVVAALLADAVGRAAAEAGEVAARLRVERADAVGVLGELSRGPAEVRPDVVLIDPMFPGGRKAMQRKPMRVLRLLVGGDADAEALLAAALGAAPGRVAVKRPLRAPRLDGPEPTVVHAGKAVRYDVYVPAAMRG